MTPGGAEDFWSAVLSSQDADGDGFSNGRELQDLLGAWATGQPAPGTSALVANPGDADSAPGPACDELVLEPPSPVGGDRIGISVAIADGLVVVGSTQFDDAGGRVELFDATTGEPLRTLENPTPAVSDSFGRAVAMEGDLVLVGASQDDSATTNAGIAYLFSRSTGSLLRDLPNPNPMLSEFFAQAVALDSGVALVGSHEADTGADNAGAAYLFDAATGTLLHSLWNPEPSVGAFMGRDVALAGGFALVGATHAADAGFAQSGRAYLFDVATGAHVRSFGAPVPATNTRFGGAVAVEGGRALIGAEGYDDPGFGIVNTGAAHLFDVATGDLLRTFRHPVLESPGAEFGNAVAMSGSLAVIGAYEANANGPGAAFLFDLETGELIRTFENPSPNPADFFGFAVAIDGGRIAIGAHQDDTAGTQAGRLYLYGSIPPCPSPTQTPTTTPTPGETPSPTPGETPSPTPGPTASPTASPTRSPSPSASPSPSPSPSTSPTASPTPSPSATASPTPTRSPTASPTASPTPSPTRSPSPSDTPSPSPTTSPTTSPTPSETPSPTPTDTPAPSPSPSASPSPSPSPSASATASASPSPSPSPSPTASPTPPPSPTVSATPSPSPTATPTSSPTPSPSPSPTPTAGPTASPTRTPTASASPTPEPSDSPSPSPSPTPSPSPAGLPAAPEGLAATAGAESVLLEWLPNSEPDLVGYNLYSGLSEGATDQRRNDEPISATRFLDTSATPGVDRFYRLTAVSPAGEGPASEVVSARAGEVVALLQDARAPAGGIASVAISLDNAEGISGGGIQFELLHDAAILTARRIETTGITSGFQILQQALEPGRVGFLATAPGGTVLQGSGGLFRVFYDVAAAAPEGTATTISFDEAILFDSRFRSVPVNIADTATFRVDSRFILGDFNGDRRVNVGDVLLAQAVAVGRVEVGPEAFSAGDVNGDGRIDAADATLIGRIALGLPIGAAEGASVRGARGADEPPLVVSLDLAGAWCSGDCIFVPILADDLGGVAGSDVALSFDPRVLLPTSVFTSDATSGFTLDFEIDGSLVQITLASPNPLEGGTAGRVAVVCFQAIDPEASLLAIGMPLARLNGTLGENYEWTREVRADGGILVRETLPCGAPPVRVSNLSTRGFVGVGADVMIGGLIVEGMEPRLVLVSGIGPDLANFGVTGVLDDPVLSIYRGSTPLFSNDDWGTSANVAAIMASGLSPNHPREAAILASLEPGEYTAILSGMAPPGASESDRTGVGLVQAFDLGPATGGDPGGARLTNLSTRLGVGSGDRVMIAGFTVEGTLSKRLLIRGLGPTLGAPPFDVPGAMDDPELTLFGPGDSGPVRLDSNTDWIASPERLVIEASGLAPGDPREPAILRSLPPGAYTAIVSGAGGAPGVALVEVYEVE